MRCLLILIVLLALSPAHLFAAPLKVAMGSQYPPMHFTDSSGNLVGFEVDLVNEFARQTGKKIEFVDPARLGSSTLELVRSGKVDFAVNSVTITDDRKELVDFSAPYFTSGTGLLVNTGFDEEHSLCMSMMLTPAGSPYAAVLAQNQGLHTENSDVATAVARITDEQLPRYRPYVLAYDWSYLAHLAQSNSSLKLLPVLLADESYGAVFRTGADTKAWDAAIRQIKASGRYQALYQRWFGATTPPPASEQFTCYADSSEKMNTGDEPAYRYVPLGERGGNYDFEALSRSYSKKDLPIIRELLYKSRSNNDLYVFIAENNIKELWPDLMGLTRFEQREHQDLLATLAEKNPETKSDMAKALLKTLAERPMVFKLTDYDDYPSGEMTVTFRTAAGKKRSYSAEGEREFYFSYDKNNRRTLVRTGTEEGVLEKITGSGQLSITIVSTSDGTAQSYNLPDMFGLSGFEDDDTILLEYDYRQFLFSTTTKTIVQVRPIVPWEQSASNATESEQGKTASGDSTEKADKAYLVSSDHDTLGLCHIYQQDLSTGSRKLLSSYYSPKLGGYGGGCGGVFMDGKLFSTYFEEDGYQPFMVVDIKTGLKLEADYGGGVIPVGEHELYYCSSGGYEQFEPFSYLIDTRTLERKKLPELPCVYKNDAMFSHPKPGKFVILSYPGC